MRPSLVLASVLLAGSALTACVSENARYQYSDSNIGLIQPSYRNPVVRRGDPRFCDNYADQTARNTFENDYDSEDGIGVDLLNEQRARRAGRAAYERCRSGRPLN